MTKPGILIGEYGNGALIQETVWLGNIPVATLRPTSGGGVAIFYVHSDHLTAPRRISRPSDDVVVWRWDSEPFGTTPVSQDPDGDGIAFAYGLRFPGQYADPETGLNYNYFRDYDPAVGRYIQSDPIGLDGVLTPTPMRN
jgi:RHS repeat-associated protein